ncbi:hypothetical protein [Pseudohongiella nitratireducens]|uniref:hypothetical protein n=1 Tax=Pseudohongiella nitratireducens TaxID=1768907 RepID=UPI0030EDFE63|tara:strand:+ start:10207 stop:11166 length:960 start_codon:yes stop_codon:yes gene_type:complete
MLKAVKSALNWVNAIVPTIVLGAAFIAAPVSAQTYIKGQHIEPAYEGYERNADGSFSFLFGYHNENWEDELDIPVGENNFFSPGDEDRGQPTHFQPRRNRFTFKVRVPADWGDKELTWTITSPNGETRTAYATLDKDYVVDHVVIASETGSLGAGTSTPESRANTPPQVSIIGDTVRSVRVGEPLELRVQVTDDGLPQPGRVASLNRSASANAQREIQRFLRAPSRITVGKVNGLFLSWSVYRGEGETEFMPQQVKSWEDTRASANSPWGAYFKPPAVPEDGVYESTVTFKEPGRYVLWARADDGGLYADQYLEVNVTQ